MGIEHRFKDEEGKQVARCPKCEHLTTERVGDDGPYFSFFAGLSGEYFVCKNSECEVDRIYGDNVVTVLHGRK